jgi:hypothetical protein
LALEHAAVGTHVTALEACAGSAAAARDVLAATDPGGGGGGGGGGGRGLHSLTSKLNLSAVYWIGCAHRGCASRFKGVFRVCRVFLCVRHGSSELKK